MQRVEDSEDVDALDARDRAARDEHERPSFISIRSHIAYPAPNAVDTAKAHGAALGEDEVRATKEVMGFDPDSKFWVDERVVRAHVAARARRHGAGASGRRAVGPLARGVSRAWPSDWDRAWRGKLRDGWREALPTFAAGRADRDALGRAEDDGRVRRVRARR